MTNNDVYSTNNETYLGSTIYIRGSKFLTVCVLSTSAILERYYFYSGLDKSVTSHTDATK